MSKKKTFAKNSIVYILGKALTLLVSVFLLPLYTKRISPDNYGYFEITRAVIDLLIPFLCMEMWSGVFRLFFSKNGEERQKGLICSSFYYCFAMSLLISLGFSVVGLLTHTKNWPLSIYLIFSTCLSSLFMYYARSLKKNLAFSVSGVVASTMNGATGLFCVLFFHMQEEAMFLALSTGYAVQILVLFFWLRLWRYFKPSLFSLPSLKEIIMFSWPLGISTLLYYLSNGFIQHLTSWFLSNADVAYYSVAFRFTSFVVVFANVLSMSWMDVVFSIKDNEERRKTIAQWSTEFFKFFAVLSVCFLPFGGLGFDLLIGEEYRSAYTLLPIAMSASFFTLSGNILINPMHSENKTVYIVFSKAIGDVCAITLFFLFLSFAPMYAAVVAYLMGLIGEYLALLTFAIKKLKLNISAMPTIVYVCAYTIAALLFVYVPKSISFAFSLASFVGGLFYCWPVVKQILGNRFVKLPNSLFKALLLFLNNNKRLVISVALMSCAYFVAVVAMALIAIPVALRIAMAILAFVFCLVSLYVGNQKPTAASRVTKSRKKAFFFSVSWLIAVLYLTYLLTTLLSLFAPFSNRFAFETLVATAGFTILHFWIIYRDTELKNAS